MIRVSAYNNGFLLGTISVNNNSIDMQTPSECLNEFPENIKSFNNSTICSLEEYCSYVINSLANHMEEESGGLFVKYAKESYFDAILERFDKKANCKVGKQCGDICIPKKSECQLNQPQQPSSSLVKGVAAGAGLLGMSTASYLAFRAKYRAGFAESAKMADEISKNVKIEDISPEQTKITFATGGFYGPMGAEGKKKAEDYFSYKLKTNILDEDHHVITHRNDEFNNPENKALIKVAELAKEGKKPDPLLFAQMSAQVVSDHYKQTLETALVKGRNPEAVKLASEVIAYHRAYPDKEIYLTGHSAGGMINHETAEILNKLNIKVNVVNFGSGYFGLTEKVGNSSTIVDRGDFYFKSMAGVRDPIYVGEDKITDEDKHSVRPYMNSPEVIKTAKSLFNQKKKADSASRKKCKIGKPCGDICIPKKNECISESTSNTQLTGAIATGIGIGAIATGIGIGAIAIPAATLVGMRYNYLMKLPESASIAKQRGEGVDSSTLKDFTDKEDIVFFQKGFDNAYGEEVKASGRSKIEAQLNSIFPNSGVVARSNELFNIPEVQTDVPGYKERFLKSAIEATIKPFVTEGRNPESLSLASEVYAYHLKYPDKPINLIGHSAGGMIAREASDILNRLGVKHKVAAIASPDFGLFDTKNYIAINSDKDPLNSVLPNFKAARVNVPGHSGSDYLNDMDTVRMLKNHFGNNMKSDTYLSSRADAIKKATCRKGKPCGDICIPKQHECKNESIEKIVARQQKEFREQQKKLTEQGRKNAGMRDVLSALGITVAGALFNTAIISATAMTAGVAGKEAAQTNAVMQEKASFLENEDDDISKLMDIREYLRKEKENINNNTSGELGAKLYEYEKALLVVEQERERFKTQLSNYDKKYSSRNFKRKDRPLQEQDFQNLLGTAHGLNAAQIKLGTIKQEYEYISSRPLMYSPTKTEAGRTPWEVLGLNKNASEDDIDAVYKRLAKKNHPDLYATKEKSVQQAQRYKFQEINQAHKIAKRLVANRKNYSRRIATVLALPPAKRSDSTLSAQEQIQLQCKILLSRATKEKIDKISAVKASTNGTLTGLFAIKNKTFKFSIDDKNITYSANSVRIDSFQRYIRYDTKTKKCKIGISCGDACIGSRKKCQLNTSQIAKPSEVSRLRLTASKLFLEQNPVSIPSTQETTKQANNYEVNPDTNKPYTIRELRKIASDRGIYGYGSMPIKELKESLMLADKNPDSSRRIAEGIVKRKTGASKLIDAAGLKGKGRGTERDTKKLIGNLIYSWKKLEALAKFAGNSPIQWSAAAVGAFLLGATARTYEQTREQYREGLDESAKIAQERAVKMNLQHPEESNGKPVIRNGKQVMTSKIKQDNITFAIGSGNGYGAEEMKELLQGGDANDKSEEWLRKSHYVIPFNLQETGSPAIPGEDRNPQVDAANDVINGFGSSMRNWKQKRNQDAVDLAAQIYAHAIAVDQSDGVTLVNKDKKINLLAHGYGGQVTKEALEILARMEIKGSPTGKEVLKQVNAVFLGTPHFGFAENVSNRQRTIISAQDPIAMLPTFGQGARQQWISSVKGHAAKDYLSDARVRDAVKEAFGYYQGSPEEVRRSQRKERSRIARQRAKVRASKKKENQSEVKPTQEQTNTDAYDIQYQATVSDLKNKLSRLDSNKKAKCKVGKPCGDICIPKKHSCNSNRATKLKQTGKPPINFQDKKTGELTKEQKAFNRQVVAATALSIGVGLLIAPTAINMLHNRAINQKNEEIIALENQTRDDFQNDIDLFVDEREKLRSSALTWGQEMGYTDIELIEDWYWGFAPDAFMQEPLKGFRDEYETNRQNLQRLENKWAKKADIEHFNNIPDSAHSKNKKRSDTYLSSRADAIKKATCKKGKPCGDICIPKKHRCESDKPQQSMNPALIAGGIGVVGLAGLGIAGLTIGGMSKDGGGASPVNQNRQKDIPKESPEESNYQPVIYEYEEDPVTAINEQNKIIDEYNPVKHEEVRKRLKNSEMEYFPKTLSDAEKARIKSLGTNYYDQRMSDILNLPDSSPLPQEISSELSNLASDIDKYKAEIKEEYSFYVNELKRIVEKTSDDPLENELAKRLSRRVPELELSMESNLRDIDKYLTPSALQNEMEFSGNNKYNAWIMYKVQQSLIFERQHFRALGFFDETHRHR